MVNSATLKAGTLVMTLLWLAIGAVWCYLFMYLPPIKGRKQKCDKGLAIAVHSEVVGSLCLLLLMYVVTPLMVPNNSSYRCSVYLFLGALTIEGGMFWYARVRHINPVQQKYGYLASWAYWFGGGGMFISGISWLIGCARPIVLEIILVSIGVLIFLATEGWFLSRNAWRFLPRKPK